jgi:hypothetical protein
MYNKKRHENCHHYNLMQYVVFNFIEHRRLVSSNNSHEGIRTEAVLVKVPAAFIGPHREHCVEEETEEEHLHATRIFLLIWVATAGATTRHFIMIT